MLPNIIKHGFKVIRTNPRLVIYAQINKYCTRHSNLGKIIELDDFPVEEINTEPQKVTEKVDVKYTKLSDDSNILSQYMSKVKSRNMRLKSKSILLEGKRLIQDALDSNIEPIAIFFSRIQDLQAIKMKESKAVIYRTSYKALQMWSDVQTSQGVIGLFKMPESSENQSKNGVIPLTIICDNIRDPGNMGSILRTAAACGLHQVLLTKGCVDIWESKVLRAACGSHFRLSLQNDLTWDNITPLLPPQCSVLLADSEKTNDRLTAFPSHTDNCTSIPAVPYFTPPYKNRGHNVLIIGGETEGLSANAYQLAKDKNGVKITIPLEKGVESLNSGIAFAVISYEIRRQLLSISLDEKFNSVGIYSE